MLIDHIGCILIPGNSDLRAIGRLSFPLFCFLIVNGFYHTKNKYNYLIRMGIFALISEIPYDLAIHNKIMDFSSQNVFITLFSGLLLIICCEKIKEKINNIFLKYMFYLTLLFAIGYTTTLLNSDYKWYGILLIFLFYLTYGIKIKNKILMSLSIIFSSILYYKAYNSNLQLIAIFASIFIFLFEDKKVTLNKWVKWFMYIFYPLHLMILYILRSMLC